MTEKQRRKAEKLSRFLLLQRRVALLEEEMCRQWARATRTGRGITGMPAGSGADVLQLACERREALRSRITKANAALSETREDLERRIAALGRPSLEAVLTGHYLCGLTLEEIADRLDYSPRHVSRLHRQALERVEM